MDLFTRIWIAIYMDNWLCTFQVVRRSWMFSSFFRELQTMEAVWQALRCKTINIAKLYIWKQKMAII